MRAGLVDVREVVAGFIGSDLSIIEGPSLTGLQKDWDSSRKSQLAWEGMYRRYEAAHRREVPRFVSLRLECGVQADWCSGTPKD